MRRRLRHIADTGVGSLKKLVVVRGHDVREWQLSDDPVGFRHGFSGMTQLFRQDVVVGPAQRILAVVRDLKQFAVTNQAAQFLLVGIVRNVFGQLLNDMRQELFPGWQAG